ncbi:Adhesion G protein-coupled receptor E4 [Nymphon striatum]|nr:Adhesion G protein-coupled receptor E4 [Nymphon striatum]
MLLAYTKGCTSPCSEGSRLVKNLFSPLVGDSCNYWESPDEIERVDRYIHHKLVTNRAQTENKPKTNRRCGQGFRGKGFTWTCGIGELISKLRVMCTVVAFVLHFLFTSAFCWMLAEGLHLFVLVMFPTARVEFAPLLIIGIVFPLVIVIITGSLNYENYVSEYRCWLNVKEGVIYAFVGPAVAIILINFIILTIIIYVFLRVKRNSDKSTQDKYQQRTAGAHVLKTSQRDVLCGRYLNRSLFYAIHKSIQSLGTSIFLDFEQASFCCHYLESHGYLEFSL